MMMEAVSTSETAVNFYETTRRNNPEDGQIHARRRENLKSHLIKLCSHVGTPMSNLTWFNSIGPSLSSSVHRRSPPKPLCGVASPVLNPEHRVLVALITARGRNSSFVAPGSFEHATRNTCSRQIKRSAVICYRNMAMLQNRFIIRFAARS
jgi:hypothetical protein